MAQNVAENGWQGYWLSRDQFGPLVMASGLGIPFEPPMEMVQTGMQMVAQNSDDQVMLPQNMLPLQAVFASDDVVAQAAAIAGLVAIADAIGDSQYLEAADGLFQSLTDDFDPTIGIFGSKNEYSVDDVAWIIGGLNFLLQKGSQPSRGPASSMLLAFYESTISLGGMQLSAPPGKDAAMAGEFEKICPAQSTTIRWILRHRPLQAS